MNERYANIFQSLVILTLPPSPRSPDFFFLETKEMDHQLAYEIASDFLGPMAERAEKYIAVTLQSLGNLLVENFDLPSGQDGFEGSKPVVKNFWYYTMQKAMLARINRMADNGEIEKLLMLYLLL